MSENSIGKILRLTTWGESHGELIGGVLDGVPPNIKISRRFIQNYLDRRAPGSSKYVTQRKENDNIEDYTRKNMETVKTCNEEKEISKQGNSILIFN